MRQLTLLLLCVGVDALNHDGENRQPVSDAPTTTTTTTRTHHATKNSTLGAVERVEKRVAAPAGHDPATLFSDALRLSAEMTAESSRPPSEPLRAASALPTAAAPKLRHSAAPKSKSQPTNESLPAPATSSQPPAASSRRAGWWALPALALLACVLLCAVPAGARLQLLRLFDLGGMSPYAQQLCSFCVLVGTMTCAMLLFKLCQVGGVYTFSPASAVALTELCKLTLALSLHALGGARTAAAWCEDVDARVMLHYAGLAAAYTFNNQARYTRRGILGALY